MAEHIGRQVHSRLFHVPLRNRAFQFVNLGIVRFCGGPLRICHVVEFPKCGGSWVRRLIQTYVGGRPYLQDRIVGKNTVIQIHRLYRSWYHRPIVVVRDVRDMYVSSYYHENFFKKRATSPLVARYFRHDPDRPKQEDFGAYLEAKLLHVTDPGFHFRQFLDSWLDRPGICLVRYEDCLLDTAAQLGKIVTHLGHDFDTERIDQAVHQNSFQNRTKATTGKAREPGEADPSQFLRKGVSGDWKNHFNERSCQMIDEHEGTSLRRLGYEVDSSWIDRFLAVASDE